MHMCISVYIYIYIYVPTYQYMYVNTPCLESTTNNHKIIFGCVAKLCVWSPPLSPFSLSVSALSLSAADSPPLHMHTELHVAAAAAAAHPRGGGGMLGNPMYAGYPYPLMPYPHMHPQMMMQQPYTPAPLACAAYDSSAAAAWAHYYKFAGRAGGWGGVADQSVPTLKVCVTCVRA